MTWEKRAEALGEELVGALRLWESKRERAQQSRANIIGVSDIGVCRERLRRMMANEQGEREGSMWPAFIGTAIGALVEEAVEAETGWQTQGEVTVTLPSGIQLVGHPDVVTPDTVIDNKTVNGTSVVRHSGPSLQQRFQVNLYAHGLRQAGHEIEWVALAYWDRSGVEDEPWVWTEPFDYSMVEAADEFVGDAIYALRNGEQAMKEPPRTWCAVACPFFQDCRAADTDVTGLIDDPETIAAVEVYAAARTEKAVADKKMKAAKDALIGVSGFTSEYAVRWIEVGPADVPAFTRNGYSKLDLVPIKRKR